MPGQQVDDTRDRKAEARAIAGPATKPAPVESSPSGSVPREDSSTGEETEYLELSTFSIHYTTEYRHNSREAVLHLVGRTADNDAKHVEVVGFDPYFYISQADDVEKAQSLDVVTDTEYISDPSIRDDDVVKVTTQLPRNVRDIRDRFDRHYEADILFPDRFLIDKDIDNGVRIPVSDPGAERHRVSHRDVEPADVRARPRIHMADLEVDDRNGFPESGEEPILCLTTHDNYRDEYVIWVTTPDGRSAAAIPDTLPDYDPIDGDSLDHQIRAFDSELDMLTAYLDYIEDTSPNVLTGWNFTDFDAEYLLQRLDLLHERTGESRVNPDRLSPVDDWYISNWGPTIKGRTVMDLLYAYRRTQFTEKESYRLDAIGEAELGVGKEHYTGDIGDLWESDIERLLQYNLRDVEICVELDRDQNILTFWDEVRTFVGCRLEDAPTPSSAVDMYILQKVSSDYVLPSKGLHQGEEYEGGEVLDPVTGLIENVATLDLKSLYPMCMMTINASPETKVDPDAFDGDTYVAPTGTHFRQDRDGILRDIIMELLDRRDEKKSARDDHGPGSPEYERFDRQQAAIKVIMNSLYGTLGYVRFRLYDKDIAAATTAVGRRVIEFTRDVIEEDIGYDVVYGDTDSCLVSLPEDMPVEELLDLGFDIEDRLNDRYDDLAISEFNATEHYFEMEFEKLYRRFLQVGKKKRYAGHEIWKEGKDVDNIDITGFEPQRSDSAAITKEVFTEVVERILRGADDEEVISYLSEVIEQVDSGEVPIDRVAIPGGLNQHLHEYDADTAHVRGAEYANLVLGTTFGKGSKPKRLYLQGITPEFRERLKEDLGLTPGDSEVYRDFLRNPDVICYEYPEQLPDEGLKVDWKKMRDKTLRGPVGRILKPLGISWSEVESGQQQSGLAEFM